jgi:myo-inositol 2-dehydrogenase/D-chiro-inositol 1-dehydrogenase
MVLAKNFASNFDHFENFPDRFEAAYRLELEAFFRALQEGRKPTPGPEDALETLRLALAVTKSWREGRSIKVAEI